MANYRSDIESDYYRTSFYDLVIRLRSYVLDIFEDLYDDRMEVFVRKLTVRNHPLIAADCLVDNTSHAFQEHVWSLLQNQSGPHDLKSLKTRLRHEGNASVYSQVYNMRTAGMNSAQKKEFCLKALQYADISAVFNIFEYMPLNPEWIRDRFRTSCGLDAPGNYQKSPNVRNGEAPKFKTLAEDGVKVREARNQYLGHEKALLDETNTLEYFESAVKYVKKVTEALKYEKYQENASELAGSADEAVSRAHYPVLTFASVKSAVPAFNPEILQVSSLSGRTDFENQKIYVTELQEVKDLFGKVGLLSDFSRQLAEKDRMVDFLGARLTESEAESGNLPTLSKILTYKGGFLSEEQTAEIFRNSLVFIDSSVWMRRRNREFAAYHIIPKTAGNPGTFVDWGTRTEMFRLESEGTEKERQSAEEARNMISLLHGNRMLKYGPLQDHPSDGEDNLIYLAKQNSDRRIVIITQESEFIRRLSREGLPNVLPLSIAGSDLVVREAGISMIWPFAVYSGDVRHPEQEGGQKKEKTSAPVKKHAFSKKLFESGRLIPDSGPLLEISSVPDTGSRVYGIGSRQYVLIEVIGTGGEGTVYRTVQGQAVKIYHRDRLTQSRQKKLELMTSNQPDIKALCWPQDCVYTNDGTFAGYVMPAVSENYADLQRSVLQLIKKSVREKLLPGWDRLSLVRLCLNFCRVLKQMHEANILMGDVNPNNIMVDITQPDRPWITIVDCDSMQLGGYPCPVGMQIYTSPEIYIREGDHPSYGSFLRTEDDELYAAASLMFRILMLNGSPFEKKGMDDISSAIRSREFAYRFEDIRGDDVPDGPYGMIWNNMPRDVRNHFGRVFTGKGSVSLDMWTDSLKDWIFSMRKGTMTKELIPNRYYENEKHEYNTDFICEECGRSTNMPVGRYAQYQRDNMPMLCPECTSELKRLEYTPVSPEMDANIPSIFHCEICGRKYRENYRRAWLKGRGVKSIHTICPECAEKNYSIRCSKCRRYSSVDAVKFAESKGGDYICDECSQKVEVRCSECGRTYQIRKYVLDDLHSNFREPVCSECRKNW